MHSAKTEFPKHQQDYKQTDTLIGDYQGWWEESESIDEHVMLELQVVD